MNKGNNKKFKWAIGLVAGIAVLSIVYAALSSTLYIGGNGEVKTGSVQFSDCVPFKLGTNGDINGGVATSPEYYDYNTNAAIAFGACVAKDATESNSIHPTTQYIDNGANIQIYRSSHNNSSDGDSLTVNGTKLYDYGAFAIYEVTLTNTAPNAMKLSAVPTIKTLFTPTNGSEQDADSDVVVTVHASLADAVANAGDTLAAWHDTDPTATDTTQDGKANWLAGDPNNTSPKNCKTKWYIKIKRKTSATGQETTTTNPVLTNGAFRFSVELTGGAAAVWTNANTNS